MQKKLKKQIAIIGGGASGLVAGITALRNGAEVSIFEKNNKLAKKILATGNGRCNVTNENINASYYHGQYSKHACKIFEKFDFFTCKDFFQNLGIMLVKGNSNRYYPMSQQAQSIATALEFEFLNLGGHVYLGHFVEKICKKDEKFILHVNKKQYIFDKILISTGTYAMENFENSQSGYEFAKYFGHSINPTFASLVQLVSNENTNEVSGVKFEAKVKVLVDNEEKKSVYGDVLLTKYGISGSAILDISRYAGEGLLQRKSVKVIVDCMSDFCKDSLFNLFINWAKINYNLPIILFLNGFINKKLAIYILKICKISLEKQVKNISKKDINSIVFCLKNLTFNIKKTKDAKFAEVIAGGVKIKEINLKTMESKLVKNLFFSGEILDIDGDCGGYNLHWAWASGYVAGIELAR